MSLPEKLANQANQPIEMGEAEELALEKTSLPPLPQVTEGKPMMLSLKDANALADVFLKSGMFQDTKGLAQGAVKILAGYEMGIGPFQAMRGLQIIKGQLTLKPQLMGAMIKNSGRYNYRVTHSDAVKCEIQFLEIRNTTDGEILDKIGVSTWTMEEAKQAGIAGGVNWQKYPTDMLFNRALGRGARMFCGDVFQGQVYVPEEMEGPDFRDMPSTPQIEDKAVADEEFSIDEYIVGAEMLIEDNGFDGNAMLELGKVLGIEKDEVHRIKKNHETKDDKGKVKTNWSNVGKHLIKMYKDTQ